MVQWETLMNQSQFTKLKPINIATPNKHIYIVKQESNIKQFIKAVEVRIHQSFPLYDMPYFTS